jgi:hypothetical protein
MTRIPPRSPDVRTIDVRTIDVRTIDCNDCVMADTGACDDCVVSFIVNREPGDAVVVDAAEARALKALGEEGLVPQLRHRTRRVG